MPFNQPNYYYNGNQMYQQLPQNQMRHRTFTNFPQQNFCTSLPFNYRGSVGTFGKGNSMSSCNPYSMGNQNVKGNLFCGNVSQNDNVNLDDSKEQLKRKGNKKDNTVIDFNSLEELLESLKGGKQIGNYIKARNNTGTMINLIKKLPTNKIGELIEMIKHKLKDIMISNNKFCQKFFEQSSAEQRVIILSAIKDHFSEIAFNKWGSYSLQALIKVVSLPEEQEIIKQCIKGKVYELSMDKQSNFVLQKLILLLNEKGMTPITDEIFQIFNHLIYNTTGIGLLKNLVLTNKNSETRKRFVIKTIENIQNLINNPTGHTLLIQMMDKWDYETCKPMILEVYKDICKYSMMRYSSIVVLKCISLSEQKLIKSVCANMFRSDNVNQLVKSECCKEIIKELCSKLPKKSKGEMPQLLENSLANDRDSLSNDFLAELSQ